MADFIQKMQDKLDRTTDEHSRNIIQYNMNVVAFHRERLNNKKREEKNND